MTQTWYVMQSKPHKEGTLLRQLEALGIETYYPAVRVRPVNPRSRKIRPLFPRYLFVRFDLAVARGSDVMWMPHSLGLVSFGGEPAPLPDRLIEEVRQRVKDLTLETGLYDPYAKGDRVRITSGPFAGYEGIFDMRLSGSDRVRILLDYLNRHSVSVQLTDAQIRKA